MNNYELILYWSSKDNAFIAEVAELSGCIADRQTYVDAVRNAETAIGEWIETAHYIFFLNGAICSTSQRKIGLRMKLRTLCAALLAAFLAAACNLDTSGSSGFDWRLQGTWASANTGSSEYSGRLVITFDRITIFGYDARNPIWGNEQQPFRGLIRDRPLPGYSQDGSIFIEDAGQFAGFPYTHWEIPATLDTPRTEVLDFTFGGRRERLIKQQTR